jgi:hypothetical protein
LKQFFSTVSPFYLINQRCVTEKIPILIKPEKKKNFFEKNVASNKKPSFLIK